MLAAGTGWKLIGFWGAFFFNFNEVLQENETVIFLGAFLYHTM